MFSYLLPNTLNTNMNKCTVQSISLFSTQFFPLLIFLHLEWPLIPEKEIIMISLSLLDHNFKQH